MHNIAHYSDSYMSGMHGNEWVGLIWMILLLAFVLVAGLAAWRFLTRNGSTSMGRDPLDIAKERYAKGEITKSELTEIKKELKG